MICPHTLNGGECLYYHANCNHSEPHKKNEKCTSLIFNMKEVCPSCIDEEVDFIEEEEMIL